jgi:hypothetical protein
VVSSRHGGAARRPALVEAGDVDAIIERARGRRT